MVRTVAANGGIANGDLIRGHAAIINSSIASGEAIGCNTIFVDDGVARSKAVRSYAITVNDRIASGNAVYLQVFGHLYVQLVVLALHGDVCTVANDIQHFVITPHQCRIGILTPEFQFHAANSIIFGCFIYILQLFFRCRTAGVVSAILTPGGVGQACYFASFTIDGHRVNICAVTDL